MTTKHKSREIALQILFAWDSAGRDDETMALDITHQYSDDVDVRLRALQWAGSAWQQRELIDPRIEQLAPQWPPRRQPAVDRNIIRLAAWELTSGQTPPKVAIDEAIELAKLYSTENSPAFVNGVLDALLKQHQAMTGETP